MKREWMDVNQMHGLGAATILDDQITDANEVLREWTGAGESWMAAMTRGSAAYWETSVMPLLHAESKAQDVAIDLRTDGGPVPILVFAQGTPKDYSVVAVPFEERHTFEQALMAAKDRARMREAENQRLRDIDDLRTRFINTIAHEFNTPMTPIKLELSRLERIANPAVHRSVARIARSLERVEALHQNIIDSARVQAGEVDAKMGAHNLLRLARDLGHAWSERNERQVTISGNSAKVWCDPVLVDRALGQVLDNARRFSPESSDIVITVKDDGSIVVADKGRGIRKDQLEKLARPLARTDDDSTLLGAGLGLFIASGLQKVQGGRFAIYSAGEGKGTTVTLQFEDAVEHPLPKVRAEII